MRRIAAGLCALMVAGVLAIPASGEAANQWRLPTRDYLPHTHVTGTKKAATVQKDFGEFHSHHYSQLGRRPGQGWLQAASVTYTTRAGSKRTKHHLVWVYAVSIYPSSLAAIGAARDYPFALPPFDPTLEVSGLLKANSNGVYGTLAVMAQGPIVIEEFCATNSGSKRKFGKRLDRECTGLRGDLRALLTTAVPPTATPTIVPTATPVPTNTPTSTPTATMIPIVIPAAPTATNTPLPTDTPVPTATSTPSAIPTDTPTATAASQNVAIGAAVSNPNPSRNSTETVYGRFEVNGQGVAGVSMDTTWHYKTTTSACSGVTDASGTASCSRDIGNATPGYFVAITVTFECQGQFYTTSTGFTPS